MSLKSFIMASVVIHVLGGIALYFYYNPILLDKKPVPVSSSKEKEEDFKEIEPEKLKLEKLDESFTEKEETTKNPVKLEKKKSLSNLDIKPKEKAFNESKKLEPTALALPDQIEAIEEYKKIKQNKEEEEASANLEEIGTKEKPLNFSSLKQRPGNPSLSYPKFARKFNMQGTNRVLFFVDERGLVDKIQLEKSSGHLELDNYVIRVLSQYQFLGNKRGWVRHTQPFVLKGEEKRAFKVKTRRRR